MTHSETESASYSVVELSTGRIVSSGVCRRIDIDSASQDLINYPVFETQETYRYDTHWYTNGAFEELADIAADWDKKEIVADGVDFATLQPLPIPCTVMVDDVGYEVLDGSFELAADAEGDYRVAIEMQGYKTKEWMIDAN